MGKQKAKHWAHIVLNRGRGEATVLGLRRPLSDMNARQRVAYGATLDPDMLARCERRETRRQACSDLNAVKVAPERVQAGIPTRKGLFSSFFK